MKNKGKLIIISGPSGVGKGTLIQKLFENKELPLVLSVSATTRPPRPGEKNGIDYHFFSQNEFDRLKKEGSFLEFFEVFGHHSYGTLKQDVDNALEQGKWIVLEIDVNGAKQVLEQYPQAKTIFILPPNETTLHQRLTHRGSESEEIIQQRLNEAQKEIEQGKQYQYQIINDEISKAVQELTQIIAAD